MLYVDVIIDVDVNATYTNQTISNWNNMITSGKISKIPHKKVALLLFTSPQIFLEPLQHISHASLPTRRHQCVHQSVVVPVWCYEACLCGRTVPHACSCWLHHLFWHCFWKLFRMFLIRYGTSKMTYTDWGGILSRFNVPWFSVNPSRLNAAMFVAAWSQTTARTHNPTEYNSSMQETRSSASCSAATVLWVRKYPNACFHFDDSPRTMKTSAWVANCPLFVWPITLSLDLLYVKALFKDISSNTSEHCLSVALVNSSARSWVIFSKLWFRPGWIRPIQLSTNCNSIDLLGNTNFCERYCYAAGLLNCNWSASNLMSVGNRLPRASFWLLYRWQPNNESWMGVTYGAAAAVISSILAGAAVVLTSLAAHLSRLIFCLSFQIVDCKHFTFLFSCRFDGITTDLVNCGEAVTLDVGVPAGQSTVHNCSAWGFGTYEQYTYIVFNMLCINLKHTIVVVDRL